MYWTVHLHGGPRRVNHAAVVIGSSIFTFGGYCSGADNDDFVPIEIYILDTVKLKWWRIDHDDIVENAPFQRCGFTTVVYNKKIYLWGGANDSQVCNILYCFDTESLKWSIPDTRGKKPAPRSGHSACMIGERMYVYGGLLDGQLTRELCMFDFCRMRWHIIQSVNYAPSPRDFHTATAFGDKMYIFGGRGGYISNGEMEHEMYNSRINYYDTKINKWVCPTVYGHRPRGRRNHSAFIHDSFLYIYGGFDKNGNIHFEDIYRYNLVTSMWTMISPIGSPPCPRRRQICLLVNERVFIYGGLSPVPCSPHVPLRVTAHDLARLHYSRLKHHDDLHVLNLNPSLKDMCLVKVCEYVDYGYIDPPQELLIPVTLRNDLAVYHPLEMPNSSLSETESEDEDEYELFYP